MKRSTTSSRDEEDIEDTDSHISQSGDQSQQVSEAPENSSIYSSQQSASVQQNKIRFTQNSNNGSSNSNSKSQENRDYYDIIKDTIQHTLHRQQSNNLNLTESSFIGPDQDNSTLMLQNNQNKPEGHTPLTTQEQMQYSETSFRRQMMVPNTQITENNARLSTQEFGNDSRLLDTSQAPLSTSKKGQKQKGSKRGEEDEEDDDEDGEYEEGEEDEEGDEEDEEGDEEDEGDEEGDEEDEEGEEDEEDDDDDEEEGEDEEGEGEDEDGKTEKNNDDSAMQESKLNTNSSGLQGGKSQLLKKSQNSSSMLNRTLKPENSQFFGEDGEGRTARSRAPAGPKKPAKFILFIQTLMLMKRFIVNIKSVSNQRDRPLKKAAIDLIKDMVYYPDYNQKKTCIQNMIETIIDDFRNSSVFLPENIFVMYWEVYIFILIVAQLCFVPIKVAFDLPYYDGHFYLFFFGNFTIWCTGFDILIQANTAIYKQGLLTRDKIIIVWNYIQTQCFADVITLAGLILVQTYTSQWFEFGFIFRLAQIGTRLDKLDKYFQIKTKFSIYYDFTILISMILLMAHISGCGFYQMAMFEEFYGRYNWVRDFGMDEMSLWDRYICSIYFTFISMITVGYGDISPISTNEKVYVIFFTILSCGVFGYCVNKISQICQDIYDKKIQLITKQQIIVQYCNERQIPPSTQAKILKYLEFQHENNNLVDEEGNKIMASLDSLIIQEFKLEYYGNILKKDKLFSQNFRGPTLNRLAEEFNEMILKKGDYVFKENEPAQRLFILVQGNLEFTRNKDNVSLGFYQKHDFIAINEFFGDTIYPYSAIVASNNCRLLYVEQQNFKDALKYEESDNERYKDMKDSINMSKKLLVQKGTLCEICHQPTHESRLCPDLHLKLNDNAVINKFLFFTPQERNFDDANRRVTKYQALTNNFNVRDQLKDIRLEFLYILYGFEINMDDENICCGQDNHPASDKLFFRMIPKIKRNKVDPKKIQKLQELDEKIQQLRMVNQDNTQQIWEEMEQQLELYSQISDDDGGPEDFGQMMNMVQNEEVVKSQKLEDSYKELQKKANEPSNPPQNTTGYTPPTSVNKFIPVVNEESDSSNSDSSVSSVSKQLGPKFNGSSQPRPQSKKQSMVRESIMQSNLQKENSNNSINVQGVKDSPNGQRKQSQRKSIAPRFDSNNNLGGGGGQQRGKKRNLSIVDIQKQFQANLAPRRQSRGSIMFNTQGRKQSVMMNMEILAKLNQSNGQNQPGASMLQQINNPQQQQQQQQQLQQQQQQMGANQMNMGNQGMMNQGMMNQGMMNQGMMNQGMMNQGMMNQGMMNQGMMNQGMMNQGMMNQGMMNQGMMNQGMMQQGMMQQGMMQQGMMNGQMPQNGNPGGQGQTQGGNGKKDKDDDLLLQYTADVDIWLNTKFYLDQIKEFEKYKVKNNFSEIVKNMKQVKTSKSSNVNSQGKRRLSNLKKKTYVKFKKEKSNFFNKKNQFVIVMDGSTTMCTGDRAGKKGKDHNEAQSKFKPTDSNQQEIQEQDEQE